MGKNNRERVLAALLACPTEREAAVQAGVSESTVKKVKAKALDILKDRLDPALFLFFFSCKNI